MEVICLEDKAFFELVNRVIQQMQKNNPNSVNDWKWVSTNEAMNLLGISSKTTLQKIRDTGAIRFSQPDNSKTILYDKHSIAEYLESNVKEPF